MDTAWIDPQIKIERHGEIIEKMEAGCYEQASVRVSSLHWRQAAGPYKYDDVFSFSLEDVKLINPTR